MPEIKTIRTSFIPRIPKVIISNTEILPTSKHITRTLPPVFDMPCVTIRRDGTRNNALFKNDPSQNIFVCPLPFYEPLQYNKKDLVLIEEQKPPTNTKPKTEELAESETPPTPKEIPCPDPDKNNPRIGDLNSEGTEKVSGFKLVEEECIVQWTPTTKAEKYLPSLNVVSTTFAITIVATTAATLTPWLTKLLKPIFKQIISKIKAKLTKKEQNRLTKEQIMTNKYRERKGLPPIY